MYGRARIRDARCGEKANVIVPKVSDVVIKSTRMKASEDESIEIKNDDVISRGQNSANQRR